MKTSITFTARSKLGSPGRDEARRWSGVVDAPVGPRHRVASGVTVAPVCPSQQESSGQWAL
ncbi:MAG TPA: hypothetical protein PKL08_05810, partial [Thermoanaerobaculaceae bacterium]|nr:hypothetical protein [Thermoanaerobaculaceae bacterium]